MGNSGIADGGFVIPLCLPIYILEGQCQAVLLGSFGDQRPVLVFQVLDLFGVGNSVGVWLLSDLGHR